MVMWTVKWLIVLWKIVCFLAQNCLIMDSRISNAFIISLYYYILQVCIHDLMWEYKKGTLLILASCIIHGFVSFFDTAAPSRHKGRAPLMHCAAFELIFSLLWCLWRVFVYDLVYCHCRELIINAISAPKVGWLLSNFACPGGFALAPPADPGRPYLVI